MKRIEKHELETFLNNCIDCARRSRIGDEERATVDYCTYAVVTEDGIYGFHGLEKRGDESFANVQDFCKGRHDIVEVLNLQELDYNYKTPRFPRLSLYEYQPL